MKQGSRHNPWTHPSSAANMRQGAAAATAAAGENLSWWGTMSSSCHRWWARQRRHYRLKGDRWTEHIILRQQSCCRLWGSGGRWLLTKSILESSHYRLGAFGTQLKSNLTAMAGTVTPAALESAARDSDSWQDLTQTLVSGVPARGNQLSLRGELLKTQCSPL